jgi:hypothetical protein
MHLSVFAQNTSKDLNNENNTASAALASDEVLSSFNPPAEKTYFWSDIDQEWELTSLYEYEYDSEGRLLKSISLDSEGAYIGEIEYTYDLSGKVLSETIRYYDDLISQMIDESRNIMKYNEFGDKIYYSLEIYEAGNWTTLVTDSITITYNNDGFPLSILNKNYFLGEFSNSSTTNSAYDSINRLLSREVSIDLGEGNIPFSRIELSYEADNEPIEFTEFVYDTNLSNWIAIVRRSGLIYQSYISFDDNVPSRYIVQEKVAENWVNRVLSETTFDGLNSEEVISEFLSGFWILKTRITKKFDEQGLPVLILEEFRNDENWQTEEAEEYINEYSNDFSEINKITLKIWDDKFQSNQNFLMRLFNYPVNISEVKNAVNFSIYPNPAHDNVVIRTNQTIATTSVMMHLFDINGKSIERRRLQNTEEQVDVKHLKSGIYFIHLSDNKGKMKTEKLIVR